MKRLVAYAVLSFFVLCGYAQNNNTVGGSLSASTDAVKGQFAQQDVSLIVVSVDPVESGTVYGGAAYENGSTAILKAIPNDGYIFKNWTKGETTESYLSPYSFTVTESASYVAHFVEVPENSIVIGQPTTTEEPLPSNSYYNYTLSEQIFTAEELGLTAPADFASVTFVNTGTAKTRNYTIYMVNTDRSYFHDAADWIAPTEDDKVFTGSVTMAAGGLTTIYFNSPFVYDGSSNIALIVDDNTGSYSRGMECRTFIADDDKTLFIYSDDTNYDPYNPTSYNGTLSPERNHVVLGLASYDYTVDVTANPEEGAVDVDEGPFYYGQQCTATATPIGDNVFYYWADNGVRVSVDSVYTFIVTGNKHLVAYFGLPVSVTVVANPEEGGTVAGGGSFGIGQPCSVTASANDGYLFTNWTVYDMVMGNVCDFSFSVAGETVLQANFEKTPSNGIVVGQATTGNTLLPTYSYYNYSLTQQIYTADEIGQACDITSIAFFNTTYEKTRDLTVYLMNTRKDAFESNNDWLVPTEAHRVFSGNVTFTVGSWVDLFFDIPFTYDGYSNLAVIIDDNTGTWDYNHMACRSYEVSDYQTIKINKDDVDFDPFAPQEYSGTRLNYKNQIILGMEGYTHASVATSKPIVVYPNPAENELYIEGNGLKKVEVYNTLGQLLESIDAHGSDLLQLNVREYGPSVYILKIHTDDETTTRRFVKKMME